jgi:protein ImuA
MIRTKHEHNFVLMVQTNNMRPDLDHLRAQVAAIEAHHRRACVALPTGAEDFDAALGGGLALGGISEFVPAAFMDEPASMAFALACGAVALAQRAGDLVIIDDATHARNWGRLYAPGLQAMGIDPARILTVQAPNPKAIHACLEDCARTTGLAGVLALAGPKAGFSLAGARRVQLAAEQAGSLVMIVQSLRTPRFAPAFARLNIASAPSKGVALRGTPLPSLGPPAWTIILERTRSGAPPHSFNLEYHHATHRLHQPTPLANRYFVADIAAPSVATRQLPPRRFAGGAGN